MKNARGFSRAVLLARDNLHPQDTLAVKNVSEEASALAELERLGEKKQAPALRVGDEGKVLFESAAIIQRLSLFEGSAKSPRLTKYLSWRRGGFLPRPPVLRQACAELDVRRQRQVAQTNKTTCVSNRHAT